MRSEFIRTFVANFLATRAAIKYDEYIAYGKQDKFCDEYEVGEAECLAERAWINIQHNKDLKNGAFNGNN